MIRKWSNMRAPSVLGNLMHAASLALLSCQLSCHCSIGDSWCEGRKRFFCGGNGEDNPPSVQSAECSVACVESGYAFCSLSAKPLEQCIPDQGGAPTMEACFENAQVICRGGYPLASEVQACPSGTFCVRIPPSSEIGSSGFTLCTLDSQPDPRCRGESVVTCDGDLLISCFSGYRRFEGHCVSADRCKTAGERGAYCTLAPDPDPLCKDEPWSDRCDLNRVIRCRAGYAVYRAVCVENPTGEFLPCVTAPTGVPRCVYGIMSEEGFPNGTPFP
jgi:hypothetical protein